MRTIQINDDAARILDFILEITDKSTDTVTYSEADIVSIAVKMFQLSVTSEHFNTPAVEVFRMARSGWLDIKAGTK